MALTDYQRKILIQTMLGEAGGEGPEGQAAVAHVVLNRANSGKFPKDPAKVALQPSQFSTWNSGAGGNNPEKFKPGSAAYERAGRVLDAVVGGTIPDITGGSTFYHTTNITPYWADSANTNGTLTIGNHQFYPSHPVPPGSIPDVASLLDVVEQGAPIPADLAQRPAPAEQLGSPSPDLLAATQALAARMNGAGSPIIPSVASASVARGNGIPMPIPRPNNAPTAAQGQSIGQLAQIYGQGGPTRPGMNISPTQFDSGDPLRAEMEARNNPTTFDPGDPLREMTTLKDLYQNGGPTRPGMNVSPTQFDAGDPLRETTRLAQLYSQGGPTRPYAGVGMVQSPAPQTVADMYKGIIPQQQSPTTFAAGDPLRAEMERKQGLAGMGSVIQNSTQAQPMNVNLANALDMYVREQGGQQAQSQEQVAPPPANLSFMANVSRQTGQPTTQVSASDMTRGMSGTGGPIIPQQSSADDIGQGWSWNGFQAHPAVRKPEPAAAPQQAVADLYKGILPLADPMRGTTPASVSQPYTQGYNTTNPLVPNTPQTITQEKLGLNPDYKPAQSVPAGMAMNMGARDAGPGAAAGIAAAQNLVPQWIKQTVQVPNPEYTAPPIQPAVMPQQSIIPQVAADIPSIPAPNTNPLTSSAASIWQKLTGQQGPNSIFPRGSTIGQSVINRGNVTQGANGLLNSITQDSDAWRKATGQSPLGGLSTYSGGYKSNGMTSSRRNKR